MLLITGNKGKLEEFRRIIPTIDSLDLDLVEIQEVDPHKIIRAKLVEAQQRRPGEAILVEDTSLFLDGMNGLPGSLCKWFLKTIGVNGIVELAKIWGARAEARTIIGFANEHGEVAFFEGVIAGEIVSPRGNDGFGWDPIFQPDGFAKTFAEMTADEKDQCSMRKFAILQLREKIANYMVI